MNEYPTRDVERNEVRHIPPDYPLDEEAYERDLLEATRRALSPADGWGKLMVEDFGQELVGVELEGSRPDTQVAITLRRPSSGQVRTYRYPIWRDWNLHGCGDDGSKPVPDWFAVNVAGWALEEPQP